MHLLTMTTLQNIVCEDIADVQGSTTTAKIYYIHDDGLGGTNVISNASGTVAAGYPCRSNVWHPISPWRLVSAARRRTISQTSTRIGSR